MKSGIYKIEHKKSGKIYIGSSANIKHRFQTHQWHLNRKSHPNKFLQSSWNKYGADNFELSSILICDRENILFYEQRIIDAYKSSDRKYGFNLRKNAASNVGIKGGKKHKSAMKRMWLRPDFRKMRRVPEPGERYGRLVLIELMKKTAGSYTWLCKCDCGKECLKKVGCLRRGDTKSCGCFNSETAKKNRVLRITHNMTGNREYRSWSGMRARCNRPSHEQYKNYGGAGISISKKWNSFETFYSDMGVCPKGYALTRKNKNENFQPENCEWRSICKNENQIKS